MQSENKSTILEVAREDEGLRLDLFITQNNNSISRTLVKKMLNESKVEVNQKVEYRANYKVKLGDQVEVDFTELDSQVESEIVPEEMSLDIIYEDKDLLVINKPAGLVTHPATGNWNGTLMNGVMYYYSAMKQVGDKKRSGLIHRLDKDTSGLIMLGKTNKGLWYYSKLFAQREIEKTYLALCYGVVPQNRFVIESYIGRHQKNRKKFAGIGPRRGKYSKTEFNKLTVNQQYIHQYSLLTAKPYTGRTHQIRVHLSEYGYPIVGDPVYSRKKSTIGRLMLHAWTLEFVSLEGKPIKLEAPIPPEFNKFQAG